MDKISSTVPVSLLICFVKIALTITTLVAAGCKAGSSNSENDAKVRVVAPSETLRRLENKNVYVNVYIYFGEEKKTIHTMRRFEDLGEIGLTVNVEDRVNGIPVPLPIETGSEYKIEIELYVGNPDTIIRQVATGLHFVTWNDLSEVITLDPLNYIYENDNGIYAIHMTERSMDSISLNISTNLDPRSSLAVVPIGIDLSELTQTNGTGLILYDTDEYGRISEDSLNEKWYVYPASSLAISDCNGTLPMNSITSLTSKLSHPFMLLAGNDQDVFLFGLASSTDGVVLNDLSQIQLYSMSGQSLSINDSIQAFLVEEGTVGWLQANELRSDEPLGVSCSFYLTSPSL